MVFGQNVKLAKRPIVPQIGSDMQPIVPQIGSDMQPIVPQIGSDMQPTTPPTLTNLTHVVQNAMQLNCSGHRHG